jgi:hypothetical protein
MSMKLPNIKVNESLVYLHESPLSIFLVLHLERWAERHGKDSKNVLQLFVAREPRKLVISLSLQTLANHRLHNTVLSCVSETVFMNRVCIATSFR